MMNLSIMHGLVKHLDEKWNCPEGEEILKNWEHDKGSLKYARSSANFVNVFKKDGENMFLRFTHGSTRSRDAIEKEVRLLLRLNELCKNTVEPVLSLNNRYVEAVDTVSGRYNAVVFKGINGMIKDIETLNTDEYCQWGQTMGAFHSTCGVKGLDSGIEAPDWEDKLEKAEQRIPAEDRRAHGEMDLLRSRLAGISRNRRNFGLIHYDFEPDNLIWREDGVYIIDFEGYMRSRYEADIAIALQDLFETGADRSDARFKAFMRGYGNAFPQAELDLSLMPLFYRMSEIVAYSGLLGVVDTLDMADKPGWLEGLEEKILGIMETMAARFGTPV